MRPRKSGSRSRARGGRGRGDERQLDLLDWLDAQPSYAPKKQRPDAMVSMPDVDEEQLDLVELIAGLGRAA